MKRDEACGAPGRPLSEVLEGARAVAYGVTWIVPAADEAAAMRGVASPVADACALGLDFAFVDAGDSRSDAECAALLRAGLEPVWAVSGPLGRIAAIQGWGRVMRESATGPDSLARSVHDVMPSVERDVARGVELGARAFVLADELASSAGWLVDPTFVRTRLLRAYRPFVEAARAAGGHAMLHSDGDLSSLASDIAGLGFRALHSTSYVADPLSVRAVRAAGIVPAGGISARDALACEDRAVRTASSLLEAGPMVLCDDGAVSSPAELDAVARVLRRVREGRG